MDYKQIQERAVKACAPLLNDRNIRIRVSAGSGNGFADGCFKAFEAWTENIGSDAVIRTGGMGYDDLEPVVLIEKPDAPPVFYANVTAEAASRLAGAYLEGGDPQAELALGVLSDNDYAGIPPLHKLPLFRHQHRIASRRCGFTDPERMDHYIAAYGGYSGFSQALKVTPSDVAEQLRQSGLRERDGEGRLTGVLWQAVSAAAGDKVVICNGIDMVPEQRASRLLLEGDPFSVLEGILIAAYATGASRAILTVPEEDDVIKQRLGSALEQLKAYGFAGEQILESGFGCEIFLREIPASPAAWEPSALLRVLEGRQAIPYLHTADDILTLDGSPALITNAETLVNAVAVLRDGVNSLAGIGTTESAGTKLVTLTGDVQQAYTVEIPFGTSIETLVREVGGLTDIKAVQPGGPTGCWLRGDKLDQPISYEALGEGWGGLCFELINIMTEERCAVEITAKQMQRLHSLSCGKCVFCRDGTRHIGSTLDYLIKGEGRPSDFEVIEELGWNMADGCVCAFGRSAARPALSALRLFKPDFEHHLKHNKCPAGQKGDA